MAKKKATKKTATPSVVNIKLAGVRGMGRNKARDPKDMLHLMLKPAALPDIYKKIWATGGHSWDQGSTSMCVSFSTNRYLISSPIRNSISAKMLPDWLNRFYKECQRNDEWPGEDYDGTSVRAAFAVLLKLGYISEYRWAFDTDTITNHILTVGPVVVGTDWTNEMFEPDSKGNIRVHDAKGKYIVVGGHAFLLCGVDRKRKMTDGTTGAYLIQNSWGNSWGIKGQAWISIAEFNTLLQNQGEAAIAVEVNHKFNTNDLPLAA